ncbi:hypothetical protein ACWOC9_03590 [Enterococcus termitis]|uniref:Uncharacterized protein n=1 Tax=Enterococcus termitis TaxID=332950 RepID=A0A1E5H759_9ENTE|nr:hypothetical protein BCR25_02830 [Enterococcus termitis]
MRVKKRLFYGSLLVFIGTLLVFGTSADASVLVQGSVLTNEEYEDLLASAPEGYELVSNEEFNTLNNQRQGSPFLARAHVQNRGWQS